jgi:hypothetical protein
MRVFVQQEALPDAWARRDRDASRQNTGEGTSAPCEHVERAVGMIRAASREFGLTPALRPRRARIVLTRLRAGETMMRYL